ncbi:MAG TPA: ATP-binding protein [Verrucomicrobiae bacterium]|nr:ATP-binding protein [Verrucomicrobiae bacterium]
MSGAAKPKSAQSKTYEDEYRRALAAYAVRGGESGLKEAYELGRRAIEEGKSLIEVTGVHHEAVLELMQQEDDAKGRAELMRAAANFSAENLSPYEMAHRAFEDSTKALRRLNELLEEEIKRIAHAVHDEAGQLLVATHLAIADVSRELPKEQQEQLRGVTQLLNQVETQLRRFSHELRPTILDDLGWVAAVRFLAQGVAKRGNFAIQIKAKVSGRFPKATEIAMYRAVQEALTNASRHAMASRVLIEARREGRVLCCAIQDDGKGFDARAHESNRGKKGLGLIGMQERLNAIGGTVTIESAPGKGTKILIRVPTE